MPAPIDLTSNYSEMELQTLIDQLDTVIDSKTLVSAEDNDDDLQPDERDAVAVAEKEVQKIANLKGKGKARELDAAPAMDGLDIDASHEFAAADEFEASEANYLGLNADVMRLRLFEYIIAPEVKKRIQDALEKVGLAAMMFTHILILFAEF